MSLIIGISALLLFLLSMLYVFLILPHITNTADMELLTVDYAHRGLWDSIAPENSMAAFARAVRAGYGIELDIQLSKDKKVMVFHDSDLKRMCGIDRRVCDLTYDQLKGLRLLNTDQTIPSLAEVLSLVHGQVPLMIEIKGDRPQPALCIRVSHMLDTYMGAFCIESFNPLILNWFKNYRPRYARGQLVTKITKHTRRGSRIVNLLLSHMLLNFLSRPDFISVNGQYRNRPVFLLCKRILRINTFVWTVRTYKDHTACRRHGFFTIFERIKP